MTINNVENAVPQNQNNNSGQGANSQVPEEVANRFNWGVFTLSWIWGIGNNTYITFLFLAITLIPGIGKYLGLITCVIFGKYGNKWAWQNKKWKSIEHFHKVQKTWACWGIGLMVVLISISVLSVIAAILLSLSQAQ